MIPPDIAATMREALRRDRNRLQELIDKGLMPLTPHWQGELDRMAQALAYLGTLPAAPAPDWSKAPRWATHHKFSPVGDGLWIAEARSIRSGLSLPIGIDWRETLVARPTE